MRGRKNAKSTKCIAQHIPTQLRSFPTKIFPVNSRRVHAFAFCTRFELARCECRQRWRRRVEAIKIRYLRLRLKDYTGLNLAGGRGRRVRKVQSSHLVESVVNLRRNQLNRFKLLRRCISFVARSAKDLHHDVLPDSCHCKYNTDIRKSFACQKFHIPRREWMTFARDAHIYASKLRDVTDMRGCTEFIRSLIFSWLQIFIEFHLMKFYFHRVLI